MVIFHIFSIYFPYDFFPWPQSWEWDETTWPILTLVEYDPNIGPSISSQVLTQSPIESWDQYPANYTNYTNYTSDWCEEQGDFEGFDLRTGVTHVSINGVSPRLSIVLTFILTIGRKPTGHPKFWMAKEPVSYYVFICIYHNVGNSQCHVHHPPVITTKTYIYIYIYYIILCIYYIGGMVTIPGHEWFLALLPYLTLPIFHKISIYLPYIFLFVLPTFTNIYQGLVNVPWLGAIGHHLK